MTKRKGFGAGLSIAPHRGAGVTLHWKSLREQFAQEYEGKDPNKNFKKQLL